MGYQLKNLFHPKSKLKPYRSLCYRKGRREEEENWENGRLTVDGV